MEVEEIARTSGRGKASATAPAGPPIDLRMTATYSTRLIREVAARIHALARQVSTVLYFATRTSHHRYLRSAIVPAPTGRARGLKAHGMRAVFDEILANRLKRRSGYIPYRRSSAIYCRPRSPTGNEAGVLKTAPDSHRLTHRSQLVTPVDSLTTLPRVNIGRRARVKLQGRF